MKKKNLIKTAATRSALERNGTNVLVILQSTLALSYTRDTRKSIVYSSVRFFTFWWWTRILLYQLTFFFITDCKLYITFPCGNVRSLLFLTTNLPTLRQIHVITQYIMRRDKRNNKPFFIEVYIKVYVPRFYRGPLRIFHSIYRISIAIVTCAERLQRQIDEDSVCGEKEGIRIFGFD